MKDPARGSWGSIPGCRVQQVPPKVSLMGPYSRYFISMAELSQNANSLCKKRLLQRELFKADLAVADLYHAIEAQRQQGINSGSWRHGKTASGAR